jgi:transposase
MYKVEGSQAISFHRRFAMKKQASRMWSLGVDLAGDSFEAALAPDGAEARDWKGFERRGFALAPASSEGAKELAAWARQRIGAGRCVRVVVESTGKISARFASALRGLGLPEVLVANPARIKMFAASQGVRDKTDPIDAAMIALWAAMNRPEPPEPPSETQGALREKTRLREAYVRDLNAWENRLGEMDNEDDQNVVTVTIEHLKKQIEKLESEIQRTIKHDRDMLRQARFIKRVKGLKDVAASTITAELGDLKTYTRTEAVSAVGLCPRQFTSGKQVLRPPRLAKGAGAEVRRVLYMSATSLYRSKGAFRAWIDQREAAGWKKMKIITALMRKLLLVARAVVVNDGHYDESLIGRAPAQESSA